MSPPRYAELCALSNFSFLRGASHPEELVARAAALGLEALAITDINSLAGVVRAFSALKELTRAQGESAGQGVAIRASQKADPSTRQPMGPPARAEAVAPARLTRLPRLIVGARLVLQDSPVHWLALPTDRAAYGRLCRLLTLGKRRAPKGGCHLRQRDLAAGGRGLMLIALPQGRAGAQTVAGALHRLGARFPGHVYLGAAPRYDGRDRARLDRLARIARQTAAPMVAVGDVLMHEAARRPLADVLTCLREHCTIDEIGTRALPNAERRLKGPAEMARLFRAHPGALARSLEIAGRCAFDLSELSHDYPAEEEGGEPAQARLARLTRAGLARRYPAGVPARVQALAEKELALVARLGFPAYFLTVHDIVAFARGRGILCQGRGSAANSVICYALGITDVAPETITMVVERFISEHRGEPPDIDVDFEHERREEVIQFIYARYGRRHAGLCATVIHFRGRSAVREVGRAMGLSEDVTTALVAQGWGAGRWGRAEDAPEAVNTRVRALGLDPGEPRLAQTLRLIGQIMGFPRHLSQHVGGFVITRDRLDTLCPIENAAMAGRTVIEWDKDDLDALGLLKVDILSLGMLTCLRKAFGLIAQHGGPRLSIASVPQEDPATYNMLCAADAVGVFQVESRAQMNFLPRMRPRTFYDLVIEVAIVRPGPIQGDMVHPYLRRRQGREAVEFPSAELEAVLGKTCGVPLFQEQAMQIAVVAAGFTPEEADRLRRSLATFRRMGTIGTFRDRFVAGMLARGYAPDFAERCFAQIEGFGEYGFPESHAAAFALLTYVSAWLKCHYPAAFACALLNAQPMGFYGPAQILRDARDHGIELRPVCVNASDWDNTLERRPDGGFAIRLGLRQITGFGAAAGAALLGARGNGYSGPEALWRRAGLTRAALEALARGDAFASLGLTRRAALWAIRALGPAPLPLFQGLLEGEAQREPAVALPPMELGQAVVADYASLRLSLRAHPMELLRPDLPGLTPHAGLDAAPARATVCGLVITRQRPGTASGVIFLTLEDETGVCNVVVWPSLYARFRAAVIGGRLLRVAGQVQREGPVIHLIAAQIEDLSHLLDALAGPGHSAGPRPRPMHPREQAKALFSSRDFR